MEDRLRRGLLTSADLDRMFSLSEGEVEIIERKDSSGFMGVIFDMDTAVMDLFKVFEYSYSTLARDLQQPQPTSNQIKDVIGSSLRKGIITLGWDVPLAGIGRFEQRFYEIMDRYLDALPIRSCPGVAILIDEIIREGNKITLMTALPRPLAIKALKKANLSPLFEGRIDPDMLLTPVHLAAFKVPTTGTTPENRVPNIPKTDNERNSSMSVSLLPDREELGFDGALLVKCCGLMRKPAVVSILITGNRRSALSAKRMGLAVIGLSGYAQASNELRAADKIVTGYDKVTLKDMYGASKRSLKNAKGPEQQTEIASVPIQSVTRSVSAPARTEDRIPKDTFAEEYGSDTM
eukprot:CAMPEP_0119036264 /NCGR_PEP_ID=MMETSP1177-20130426/3851_1 /TAXON_ID=2985 /ORGANISM="Ochromonas sp, Strain CCMP1899" /LENGTH=348 /DNA_ID=CAMNT_0006995843 /DNA_START=254 /DNA_END=1300 /DNA_ORIENTATION=-